MCILKALMDNLNNARSDRLEAYRQHALPKSSVRKFIRQLLGQQVLQPIAQIVAGFAKVAVVEILAQTRAFRRRRGDCNLPW
ncbi:hypothetical protein WOLCODRAFT_78856 [Wolfiporia cocos MD-104 SS10]|uniref:TAFII28-like protein domain-containing protein n=1 Tax=Wolfiporia cocos (strain MD-104) TaxID=742152 RepID=A0A2H3JAF8_WOLCO|nr:hypothetical protein WOLCODRAFT_78856 [Wolfiporia cocos MD-104 SS10]